MGTMRPALRSAVSLVMVLVVYFALPEGKLPSAAGAGLSVGGMVIGGAVLAGLITAQVRRQMRSEPDQGVKIQSLLMLLYVAVLFFAVGYFTLARTTDHQFAGLETKVDALYFTMTTLGTVGYGDIHATGQVARALVTGQIGFNLVFVGALVSLLTGRLRQRAQAAGASGHGPQTG